jgi:hypothetical protein
VLNSVVTLMPVTSWGASLSSKTSLAAKRSESAFSFESSTRFCRASNRLPLNPKSQQA